MARTRWCTGRQALPSLPIWKTRLATQTFLCGDQRTLADIATFPFVRQFAATDQAWFDSAAVAQRAALAHPPDKLRPVRRRDAAGAAMATGRCASAVCQQLTRDSVRFADGPAKYTPAFMLINHLPFRMRARIVQQRHDAACRPVLALRRSFPPMTGW